jgi:hypothetical protein
MSTVGSVDTPFALLTQAMENIKERDGLLLEFDVFSGSTINHVASLTDQTIYRFDSFEGLPKR